MIKMNEITKDIEKKLQDWNMNKLSAKELQYFAEKKFELLSESLDEKQKETSVEYEVISQLEILNHQLIIKEDIPVIIQFLKNENWEDWEKYWNQIDFKKRKKILRGDKFYSI